MSAIRFWPPAGSLGTEANSPMHSKGLGELERVQGSAPSGINDAYAERMAPSWWLSAGTVSNRGQRIHVAIVYDSGEPEPSEALPSFFDSFGGRLTRRNASVS